MNTRQVIDSYKKNFAPFVRPYYREPLVVDRAEGVYIWDAEGRRYLDAYCGVATVSFGHSNRRINDAIKKQMERFGHVSNIYENELSASYAERLIEKCGKQYSKAFFVNSGSEAVDLAILMVRIHCKSETVFTLSESYHGGSYLSKFATGLDTWHPPSRKADDIYYITSPECFNCKKKSCDDGERCICLHEARQKFSELNAAGRRPIMLLEPVPGVGGILTPPLHYFRQMAEIADEYNVFLICDEVQTGFGRCGSHYFGFQKFGLNADIVCMGKAIANGMPLGAVVFGETISESTGDLMHFNTFGGNPLSLAAAKEVLNVIDESGVMNDVEKNGAIFLEKLRNKFNFFEIVNQIRGIGYLIGMEMESAGSAGAILNIARDEGLLLGIGGRHKNVVRIQPSLTFNEENIESAVEMLSKTFEKLLALKK